MDSSSNLIPYSSKNSRTFFDCIKISKNVSENVGGDPYPLLTNPFYTFHFEVLSNFLVFALLISCICIKVSTLLFIIIHRSPVASRTNKYAFSVLAMPIVIASCFLHYYPFCHRYNPKSQRFSYSGVLQQQM